MMIDDDDEGGRTNLGIVEPNESAGGEGGVVDGAVVVFDDDEGSSENCPLLLEETVTLRLGDNLGRAGCVEVVRKIRSRPLKGAPAVVRSDGSTTTTCHTCIISYLKARTANNWSTSIGYTVTTS